MSDSTDVAALVAGIELRALVGRYVQLKRDGVEWRGLCPFHDDHDPSFYLYEKAGHWRFKCFACGEAGDALDFVERLEGVDRAGAIRLLRGPLPERLPDPEPMAPVVAAWRPILPVPDDAPRLLTDGLRPVVVWNPKAAAKAAVSGRTYRGSKLYPSKSWAYRDAAGRLLGWVLRCDFEDGTKWTPAVTWARSPEGETCWATVGFPAPRPLFGLELLAGRPKAGVLVVEGEKAAVAARGLFPSWVVVTWPGGANAVRHVDWAPLTGRDVVLWPDADEAGVAAAGVVAGILLGRASRLRVFDVSGQTPGWDAADALEAGWTPLEAVAWAKAHVGPWGGPPPPVSPPGPQRPKAAALRVVGGTDGAAAVQAATDADPTVPVEFSEDAIASQFTGLHGGKLRYVAAWGHWYRWTGAVWAQDTTLSAFNDARAICRWVAQSQVPGMTPALARSIKSSKTTASVVRLAMADPVHAATVDQWDRDPWVLNTPGGVVDLRSGALRSHEPLDYCTKMTSVTPGGSCPTWMAFLERAMGGDRSMVLFLQRICGYALTGSVREHAMFFCFGTGGNGKGTFLNTMTRILKDYARVAPMEAFAEVKGDRHPTELAMLRGARLVVAQETEEGQRWAESRIKALTGGDPISARFMRQDFFEYTPSFKLVIAGNHKPSLRAPDEALRRRFHMVPFDQVIPAAERDVDLGDKLMEEAPGILAWAIDGCTDYLERSLAPPDAVQTATAAYLEDEDPLAAWLEERCIVTDASAITPVAVLYADYRNWCERAGQGQFGRKRFTQNMELRGFLPLRTRMARSLTKVRLVDGGGSQPADWWDGT